MTTYHGSREDISWTVVRNNSYKLFGADESAARADYEKRSKTLHKGETIRLERRVRVECWVQHTDIEDERTRVGSNTDCLCDGGAYEVKEHPFLVHPDCPIHGSISSAEGT